MPNQVMTCLVGNFEHQSSVQWYASPSPSTLFSRLERVLYTLILSFRFSSSLGSFLKGWNPHHFLHASQHHNLPSQLTMKVHLILVASQSDGYDGLLVLLTVEHFLYLLRCLGPKSSIEAFQDVVMRVLAPLFSFSCFFYAAIFQLWLIWHNL